MLYSVLVYRDKRKPQVVQTDTALKQAETDPSIAFCFGRVEAKDEIEAESKLKEALKDKFFGENGVLKK